MRGQAKRDNIATLLWRAAHTRKQLSDPHYLTTGSMNCMYRHRDYPLQVRCILNRSQWKVG